MAESVMDKIAHDGGWKSRKLWFSILALLVGVAIGFYMPTASLTLVLDFIVTVVAIFTGGATGIKMVAGVAEAWKARGTQPPGSPPLPPAPKPAPPKVPPPVPKKPSEDDSE
jgi:hypothetical protein